MRDLFPVFQETTYTPLGDENLLTRFPTVMTAETTYTPSEDENAVTVCVYVLRVSKQPTPRQGTKTSAASPRAPSRPETTHAPSGDENKQSSVKVIFTSGNNLRPARGREPNVYAQRETQSAKQPTPRQGTKTA